MAQFYGRDAAQKEFLKLFQSLTGRYSRWEVWKDMTWLFATTISNAVDKRFYAQREQAYMDIIKRYKPEEVNVFPDLFGMLIMTMDADAQAGGYQDFLGELFMNLELGNDAGGQFFTPYSVCMAMAEMSMDENMIRQRIEKEGFVSINDPACGAGATLIAAADVMRRREINFQQTALFIGQDIDYTTGLMCYVQLSLLGCPGYVRIGNTLTDPMTGSVLHGSNNDVNTWYMPMYFSERWSTLRAIDKVKRLLSSVATPIPSQATQNPKADKPVASAPGEAVPKHENEQPRSTDDGGPAITIKTVKGRGQTVGQLMFEF